MIHANRLIQADEVMQNLLPMGNTPTTERVARLLTRLPKSEQKEAWSEAVAGWGFDCACAWVVLVNGPEIR